MARARKEPTSTATEAPAGVEDSAPTVRQKPLPPARATKAMAAKLQVREDEEPWTVAELNEVFGELTEQRDRLVDNLAGRQAEFAGLMKDSGDGAGQDTADMGATNFERDHEINMMNSERAILSAVDAVLAKIADGTFGVCATCGEPIGKMRVMAFPRATLCMSCKKREERR